MISSSMTLYITSHISPTNGPGLDDPTVVVDFTTKTSPKPFITISMSEVKVLSFDTQCYKTASSSVSHAIAKH